MKIAYFIDHLRPDGTQYVLRQLVLGLASRHHVQTVFCLNDSFDPALLEQLKQVAGVEIIGKSALLTGIGFLRMLNQLRREKYDVVITMLMVADILGKPLAKMAGNSKIVSSIQTHDLFYNPLQRWLVKKTMPLADLVLLNSEHVRDFAIHEEGASPNKLRVIYNSVAAQKYTIASTQAGLKDSLSIPQSANLLGCVGRLTHQKGYDILLSAFSLLETDNTHLLIAGVGELESELKKLASSLQLDSYVHFLGYRRDVPELLSGLDLYVHASRYEGMPIAVLEAMACGCAVVASAVDGNRELIDDGVDGWLVPPEDPQSLANVISEALSDAEQRRLRGKNARKKVETRFDEKGMIDSWETTLQSLLN